MNPCPSRRVYTLEPEAFPAGKAAHCIDLPWYAGRDATVEALRCERRTRSRTVDEPFAAGYLRYASYLTPKTTRRGSIFVVIGWFARQRRMVSLIGGTHG